jgi:serine/threonine-protein kinase
MKLVQAIDVAVQVASALAAAHQAGIVHRDIKPENVMLRPDGYIKVLDFGLAKLTQTPESRDEMEALTLAMDTDPGTVMGTASYMSPEQARGQSVDARTDIFSLGVVLYEMVAGRVPFEGETTSDVIAAILGKQPPPLARYEPEASAEIEWIVTKALRKQKDERYQTIKEMLSDLKDLKQGLDAQARVERGARPELESGSTGSAGSEPATTRVPQNGDVTVRSTSSAEYLVDQINRYRRGAALALAAAVIAIAATAYFFYFAASSKPIDSIAVLPFANQNHDPETDYLSDGFTESIINSLTQLPNLRVIARNSVFRYKGRDTDPIAAGNELGVRAVLTGRIMQRGENLNISAELVDVRDNKQLWGEQYERRVLDLMGVQREIAKEISGNLRLKLSGAEQSLVTKRYTENPEAYQLYLKGRYFWNKFTPADHQRAAEYFNQAIAKDPTYALAYTGLADTYGASATNNWIAPTEGYAKGKAAVKKALELDETLAEAHATLGALTMFYDLDWAAAEREYKRAIELNPNYPTTYEVYSYLLTATGRLDEGIAMVRRGLELDPLSVLLSGDTGQAYYCARRYDEAIQQMQKSIVDPNDAGANIILGEIYEQKGMYDEAIAAYQKAISASERTSTILGLLGHAYATSGRRAEALKILAELEEMSTQKYVSPYDMAVLYTGLGEKDRAIEQLNKAYEQRAGWVINLKVEPLFDPLRSDPRFADIVRRMSL